MKFMNMAARNWTNHYQDEANPDGGDGGSGDPSADPAPDPDDVDPDPDPKDPPADPDPVSDDWRESRLILKDETGKDLSKKEIDKQRNILKRYTDESQFNKSFFDLKTQAAKGFKAPELPKDATEEQVKEYRKAVGLPETVEDYNYNLPEGLVLGEEDKAITDGLKEIALNQGVKPEQMSAIIEGNMKLREAQMKERENRDAINVENSTKMLEERWGTDMPHNLNAIDNFFNALPGGDDPEGVKHQFINARTPSGNRIFDDPAIMHLFATAARKANPESILSSGDGGGVGGRLEELKTKMEKEGSLSTEERNEMARLKDLSKGIMQDSKK